MKMHWMKHILAAVCICCMFWLLPVAADAAEVIDGHAVAPVTAAMAVTKNANVRSGPAVSYQKVGSLQAGQAVNVCGQTDNGWYQIVYGTGIAYMSGSLLTQIPVDDTMLAALASQAVYVKQNSAQLAQAAADQAAQAAAAGQAAADQAALAAQQAVPGSGNIIFVGDSRTGQMGNAVGGTAAYPGVAFVSCFGGGHSWLSSGAGKREIDQFVTPGSIIVINYGVNDLSKHNDYIATINKYNREWREKGALVYFASVGPVGPNEYGKRNWAVEYFNNQLISRLDGSIGRIDLYTYLATTGANIQADGLHYQPDTYARMFSYLMQSIGKM